MIKRRDGAHDQGRVRGDLRLRVAIAAAVRVLEGGRPIRNLLRQADQLPAGVLLRVPGVTVCVFVASTSVSLQQTHIWQQARRLG